MTGATIAAVFDDTALTGGLKRLARSGVEQIQQRADAGQQKHRRQRHLNDVRDALHRVSGLKAGYRASHGVKMPVASRRKPTRTSRRRRWTLLMFSEWRAPANRPAARDISTCRPPRHK
jgi:hypothetical protein